MPCKVTIKANLEQAVAERAKDGLGKSLPLANQVAKRVNSEFKYPVVQFVAQADFIDMRVSIPKELVDIYYNNELKLEEKEARKIQSEDAIRTGSEYDDRYLFGQDQELENLVFHINTLNTVSNFLESIGVQPKMVNQFLSPEGDVIEGALAAANFIEGTVDILNDFEKRPDAWNKLPEEAAHFWYRLLQQDSPLKKMLWESHETALKADALYKGKYGKLKGVTKAEDLTEEAIGQLIAEAIKRIEDERGSPKDYSFFKSFLAWINKIIKAFKTTRQDPFEIAAMKILASDTSDLLTWEQYNTLHNKVYFEGQVTHRSAAPVDLTLFPEYSIMPMNIEGETNFALVVSIGKDNIESIDSIKEVSPYFKTSEELYVWIATNLPFEQRQKQVLEESRNSKIFYENLINKKYRKRSRYLKKTLDKLVEVYGGKDSEINSFEQLADFEERLEHQVESVFFKTLTKKLTPFQKAHLEFKNKYLNYTPTLKILPSILTKYKNRPIALKEVLKVDGMKKEESKIIEFIKDLIIKENPDKKTITSEEFVNEVHNYLETNYSLGFAYEKDHLYYNIDNTFKYVEAPVKTVPRVSLNAIDEDIDVDALTQEQIMNMTIQERQELALRLSTKSKNPSVYHDKISLRYNDTYFVDNKHFQYSPSAWGNLTYFYTGNNPSKKDAVLLHEIQNDHIEDLKKRTVDNLPTTAALIYGKKLLNQRYNDILDDILTQKESLGAGFRLAPPERFIEESLGFNSSIFFTNILRDSLKSDLSALLMNEERDINTPLFYDSLQERLSEQIQLYEGAPDRQIGNVNKRIDALYDLSRSIKDFIKIRGGLKKVLEEEKVDLKAILENINSTEEPRDGFPNLTIKDRKRIFVEETKDLSKRISDKLSRMYGKPINIYLEAPAMPLRKGERNTRTGYRRGQPYTYGNASNYLSTSVKWVIAYNEKKLLDSVYKKINDEKGEVNRALGRLSNYKSNKFTAKITLDQYVELLKNAYYNYSLLKTKALEYGKKIGASVGTRDLENLKFQAEELEKAKKYTSETFESFVERSYIMSKESESDSKILERELGYLTPLVHHLIQTHIKNVGKSVPMYFSGFDITMLTQKSYASSLLYAGKEEVPFTEEQVKNFKIQAAEYFGLVKEGDSEKVILQKLKEFQSENSFAVTNFMKDVTGKKPYQTGYIYNVISQMPGIKLIRQNVVPGILGNTGGYLVDLTNYNYTVPLLYGLDTSSIESIAQESKENTITLKDGKTYTYDQVNAHMLSAMRYSPEEIGQLLKKLCK